MRIKVESVERAPRPEEYGVYCDDCSAHGKTHPVDIVTFDVVMGGGHYIVWQPSVWRSYHSWSMHRSEDVVTHIRDYDEFSRVLEGIELPDLPMDEYISSRLKLVAFTAMLWYDQAPTQSRYNSLSLYNLVNEFSWWHHRSLSR